MKHYSFLFVSFVVFCVSFVVPVFLSLFLCFLCGFLFFFFETEFQSCYPGWSAMVRSQLTATSTSWVQAILPQPPEWLGLQAPATIPA